MITIFSTSTCVYCSQVEKYLKMKNVECKKVLLDDDPTTRQELYEKTGAMTVPITTNGKTYVVGYNIRELNELIKETV